MKQGYIQVYTGDGKGKTTAAIGLALRAAGNNMNIFIAQFVKGRGTGELKAFEHFENVTIRQYGLETFITDKPIDEVIAKTKEGFAETKKEILSGKYDLVVLDEINIAIFYKMLTVDEVLDLIDEKPSGTELILTGRRAPADIIAKADLVTEMRKVKHYYDLGIPARKGIEF